MIVSDIYNFKFDNCIEIYTSIFSVCIDNSQNICFKTCLQTFAGSIIFISFAVH